MSEYNIQMNKYNALNAEYDQLYPQPMKHASTHAKDGDDPITPSSIGAAELGADGKVLTSQLPSMEVDAYTKVQTLSDTTKTLFGLDANAVPDDVLSLIKTLIDNANASISTKAKIQTGSYVGTGTYGASNPCSLTFDFEPKLLFLLDYKKPEGDPLGALIFGHNSSPFNTCMSAVTLTTSFNTKISNGLGSSGIGKKSADGKTFYWYSTTSADAQFNYSGWTYRYMYIG